MPNPLTGDFEAVLHVSGGTINRLLASMHQNAGSKPGLPTFPTSLWIRIGDTRPIDGVRGSVQAQISTPIVELIDGSTDRFFFSVAVRARYKADPGSSPLPEFIHGTVRAQYRIQDIDPRCLGWSTKADSYLWIRVVKDSVQFHGTAEDDHNPFLEVAKDPVAEAAADALNLAKVTRQIAGLLATRFTAVPHPMSKHFRRGSMRSLSSSLSDSCVVMPVALTSEPVGSVNSINTHLLGGWDVAVAVTRDYVMTIAQPLVDAVRAFHPTISVGVHVDAPDPFPGYDISTVYRVSVDPPTVDWIPSGTFAVIKVKVNGSAKTDSVLPNATFSVDQDVVVSFDGGSETLRLTPGSRTVTASASGLGAGIVAGAVKKAVHGAVTSFVDAACAQAQGSLDAIVGSTHGPKQELIQQLRSMDDQADVSFEGAQFVADGVVLRGAVRLVRRKSAVATFDKTLEKDGFSGLFSWIPGGRVETVEWSWTPAEQGASGAANYTDRFILRRPVGRPGRFGLSLGLSEPLPGIDGNGQVCLRIKGVQMDATTGAWIPVETTKHCTRFGIDISVFTRKDRGRLLLRDVPELSRPVPFAQLAVMAVEGSSRAIAANTLLLSVGRAWDQEVGLALRSALEGTSRRNAGLVLLVLFNEGVLGAMDAALVEEMHTLRDEFGLAIHINEDVRGTWARAFALPEKGHAWRLLSPAGGVTWMRDGRVTAKELAAALDHYLMPSPPPRPTAMKTGIEVGARISVGAFVSEFDDADSSCPPPPFARASVEQGGVSFVRGGSAASEAQLHALAARHAERGENGPLIVAVVDGADAREVDALKNRLGLDFPVMADPQGIITDRFGVRVWPTTITFDPHGIVSSVDVGAPRDRAVHPDPANSKGEAS